MKYTIQLITTHNHLSYHHTELNTCQYCNEFEEETALHIIYTCPVFSTYRMEICGELPTSMSYVYSLAKSYNDDLKILGKFLGKYG